jgi:hypothetical protein
MDFFIDMFLQQIPANIRTIDFYTKPVPSSWGIPRLSRLCSEDFSTTNLSKNAFLFVNNKKNLLRLLYVENDSSQLLERMLIEGTFLTPTGNGDSDWVQFSRKALPAMLKIQQKKTKKRS